VSFHIHILSGSIAKDKRMPTGGLLDNPQDAKFYDYHLEDAKDKPFAVFKFHYRSWETLISQELIPSDHPQHLLMPSASILSLNGNPKQFHAQVFFTKDIQ